MIIDLGDKLEVPGQLRWMRYRNGNSILRLR